MLCPPSKPPTNLSGGAQLSTLTPFPVSVMTSPVKSFSLKKLFSHQEEIKVQIRVMLLFQPCGWLSSSPSPVSRLETLLEGMVKGESRRMAPYTLQHILG